MSTFHYKAVRQTGEVVDRYRAAQPVYICPTCGYTVIGDPPVKCPVSQTSKDKFVKF